jgi:hypothetical protein
MTQMKKQAQAVCGTAVATCTDSSKEAKAEGGESRRGSAHESVRAMNEE